VPALVDLVAALELARCWSIPIRATTLLSSSSRRKGALEARLWSFGLNSESAGWAAVPMEGNAVVAEPDGERHPHVDLDPGAILGFEAAWPMRRLARSKVRVIAGDVGGAFGAKAHDYEQR